ncbi:MAG: hypothetical protein KDE27_17070, partial [Planctomycetes bacterium]|nr:hypothetical protein [Planctomycetota bacterium]
RDIAPEGDFLGMVQRKADKKGNIEDAALTWTSFDIMSSAIQILQDGSLESISDALGGAHKVRNLYNNILDPKAKVPFVTSDTHQVAANLLMPLGASAAEVQHSLGTGRGSAAVAELGLSGTYWR